MKKLKLSTKTAIAGILLLLPVFLSAQIRVEEQLFIEIKDTTQTAYLHYYNGEWVQKGFTMSQVEKKDSIGIDSIRITRFFYYDKDYYNFDGSYVGKKVFIDLIIKKEYLSKRKGNDYSVNYAN